MKYTLDEYLNKLPEETRERLENGLDWGELEVVRVVEIGYGNEEEQKDGYFRDKEPNSMVLLEANQTYSLDNKPIWVAWKREMDESSYEVFTNEKEATEYLATWENQGLPSVESIVDNFIKSISNEFVTVKVKPEYNNGGHFISYNVFYNENMLEDGVFQLDDDVVTNVGQSIDAFDKGIDGFTITNLEKKKSNFERYYEVTLEKDGFETTQEVYKRGMQGKPESVLEFLQNNLDLDVIKNEFEEYQQEQGLEEAMEM